MGVRLLMELGQLPLLVQLLGPYITCFTIASEHLRGALSAVKEELNSGRYACYTAWYLKSGRLKYAYI